MLEWSRDPSVGWWSNDPIIALVNNPIVLAQFALKVRGGGDWDLKTKQNLRQAQFSPDGKGYHTAVMGDNAPESLYYDAWGNILYGYVGRAHGIPAWIIRQGGVFGGGVDTPSDRKNVDIGISLWDQMRRNLWWLPLQLAIQQALPVYRADADPTELLALLKG